MFRTIRLVTFKGIKREFALNAKLAEKASQYRRQGSQESNLSNAAIGNWTNENEMWHAQLQRGTKGLLLTR